MSSKPLLGRQDRQKRYNGTGHQRGACSPPLRAQMIIPQIKCNSKRKAKVKRSKAPKMDTMEGVTLPTILNVLSILMFLRFGFIIGQMGVIGTIGLLLLSYGIDLLTTLSVSAIATNGTVKGGGAYYMLSRSLGVEFGGAIGVIFFIGQVLNSSMNVAGVIEPLMFNFSRENGVVLNLLPEGYWWQFGYCSIFLFLCIIVSLIGSSAVSRAGTYLCIILVISTLTIPLSALIVKPFTTDWGIYYTGLSWNTFHDNLWPHFTKGAAGSQLKSRENFNDLFGIFFPATAGILAGASMSGDLKNPSKSIPSGTLVGLLVTFACYLLVILSMGASIPRELLYKDVQVIQSVNFSAIMILAGEMSTSIFSIIVGIVGAAKLLQAIARDKILPGLSIFGNGDKKSDDPKEAILLTWIICQLFLFADLNQIATLITMAFLMTFIVTNMACALLKIGSAPNFRPSFKYFSTKSAFAGTISCFIAMFIVDGVTASLILVTLMCLILVIHFVSPPKQWGDVSQSLIYHQVRKYLFKLRQDNVKYWRPQVLLLVDNPRTSWKLITFCNHLKKGGLYVLGHVVVSNQFQARAKELNLIRENWVKVRDLSNIKAFVQMSIAPTINWGVRNVFLGCGLGGMKPNITIVGFYDLKKYKGKIQIPQGIVFECDEPKFESQTNFKLPTDNEFKCYPTQLKITEWVSILEDLSMLNSNIAIAKGFPRLDIASNENNKHNEEIKFIDLYPIQMVGSTIRGGEGADSMMMTNNFDTCTLILQLGAILSTVPAWKNYQLRVIVFVEEVSDVEIERRRVNSLLEILRMKAEVIVLCLKSGNFEVYDLIATGESLRMETEQKLWIEEVLKEDQWWNEVCEIRKMSINDGSMVRDLRTGIDIPIPHLVMNGKKSRRMTFSKINQLGMSVGMGMVVNSFQHEMRDAIDDYEESELESSYSVASSNVLDVGNTLKPVLSKRGSTASVRKMMKSAFSAQKMPVSKIKEGAIGNEPSIQFNERAPKDSVNKGEGQEEDEEEDEEEEEEEDDDDDDDAREESVVNEEYGGFKVKFGDMTRRCQFLVINEMMKRVSRGRTAGQRTSHGALCCDEGETGLIFTTLPAPEVGVHNDEVLSVDYVVDLALWTQQLPPIILLNAKTITVTSNL